MLKSNFAFWLSLALCSIIFGYCSAQEVKDPSTGKTFPMSVTYPYEGTEYSMDATGVSTRKKFFAKVYSVAHYMEDPSSVSGPDKFAQILDSSKAKMLVSIWVRNVGQKKVRDGYRESLSKAMSNEEMVQLSSEIDQFLGFFGDVKNGEMHVLRWMPDGMLIVEIDGKEKGRIKNGKLAKGVWSIWLGEKSVVKRDQLISKIQ